MNTNNTVVLNLGCGNSKKSDEIGVDIFPGELVDIVADLNVYPLPFEDDSIDSIVSSHCFEHLNNLIGLIEELHRILKPSGILEFTVPHVSNIEYFRDPTHVRPFTLGTMDYFVKDMKPIRYTDVQFRYVDRELRFGKGLKSKIGMFLAKLSERRYEKYQCWNYPCYEIYYKMEALK